MVCEIHEIKVDHLWEAGGSAVNAANLSTQPLMKMNVLDTNATTQDAIIIAPGTVELWSIAEKQVGIGRFSQHPGQQLYGQFFWMGSDWNSALKWRLGVNRVGCVGVLGAGVMIPPACFEALTFYGCAWLPFVLEMVYVFYGGLESPLRVWYFWWVAFGFVFCFVFNMPSCIRYRWLDFLLFSGFLSLGLLCFMVSWVG